MPRKLFAIAVTLTLLVAATRLLAAHGPGEREQCPLSASCSRDTCKAKSDAERDSAVCDECPITGVNQQDDESCQWTASACHCQQEACSEESGSTACSTAAGDDKTCCRLLAVETDECAASGTCEAVAARRSGCCQQADVAQCQRSGGCRGPEGLHHALAARWEFFEEMHHMRSEFHEQLLEKNVVIAELDAQLEVAEKRIQMHERIAEFKAENAELRAAVHIAKSRRPWLDEPQPVGEKLVARFKGE